MIKAIPASAISGFLKDPPNEEQKSLMFSHQISMLIRVRSKAKDRDMVDGL
jgi:hypothetical protein